MFGGSASDSPSSTTLGCRLIRADLVPDLFETSAARAGRPPRNLRSLDRELRRLAQAARRTITAGSTGSPPPYAVLFAIVGTIIAFDGIMALQPHWFSNLFGAFYFMGSFLGAHMLLALMMIYGASHLGITDLVSPKQRHDLGKLCFGFTVFWTYLMWAQFLVIWYGNMPEETGFVFSRLWGRWLPVGTAVVLGMFVIPFFGLLGVAPKKIAGHDGFFATVSLVALWLERYLLVMPSVTRSAGSGLRVARVGPTLLFLGLYLLAYALFARTFPMISPRLAEITLDRERAHPSAVPPSSTTRRAPRITWRPG